MDKEFFLNAGMPPPLQFDHPFSSTMPSWHSLSSAMEIQTTQSPSDCFLSPRPTPDHFESALSSMVSSPGGASGPNPANDNFMIRELIGKLGNICNSGGAPPHLPPYIGGVTGGGGGGNCSSSSNNNSCYSTPLSSPPKVGGMPMIDHQLVKDTNFTTLGNSLGLSSNLPAMPGDPGFAERAARFSSFGSRSFNGRTSQFVANSNNNNNGELGYRSNSNLGGNGNGNNGKLQRVSSSPSLKVNGSQVDNNKSTCGNSINERKQLQDHQGEMANSRENSSVSGGENAHNRKRKAAPKGKAKVTENGEDSSAKRSKSEESSGKEDAKTEENRGDESKKQGNSNQKPPEAPKDYIHVRARRGQATDSHSLAERVRREKISERMKLLQDLVPGCNKVTGKALMLDEIINYVQSLQRQVEFLSMKLASVNPSLDCNMDDLFSKDVNQPNCSVPHPMYPIDSLAPTLYGQSHQSALQTTLTTSGTMAPCPMDPLNPNHGLQLPLDRFANGIPQLASLCEGDLQSIVSMSYGQKQKENGCPSQTLHGPNQTPLMKIEF